METSRDIEYVTLVLYYRSVPRLGALSHGVLSRLVQTLGDQDVICSVTADEPSGRHVHVWEHGERGSKCRFPKQPVTKLLEEESLSSLESVSLVAVSSDRRGAKRKFVDFRWNLSAEDDGAADDPVLMLSVNVKEFRMTTAGRAAATAFCRSIVDCALQHGDVFHGLIDVSANYEQFGGSYYYSYLNSLPNVVHRLVNREAWRSLGPERPHWVRGIYWGMLLNSEVQKRVDPTGAIFDQYEQAAFPVPTRRQGRTVTYRPAGGGILLQLSPSPLDFLHDNPASAGWVSQNAFMVYQILRQGGVLM